MEPVDKGIELSILVTPPTSENNSPVLKKDTVNNSSDELLTTKELIYKVLTKPFESNIYGID